MLMKKITKLIVGTNNKGKLREIKNLLPKNLEIHSPQDFNLKSPIENGKTFQENALIKARYFSKKTKMICLSDDSGIEIDILNGNPGIYSARWGGKGKNFVKAMHKVFKKLKKFGIMNVKLVSGDVIHQECLVPLSKGEILACQSKPVTDIKITAKY